MSTTLPPLSPAALRTACAAWRDRGCQSLALWLADAYHTLCSRCARNTSILILRWRKECMDDYEHDYKHDYERAAAWLLRPPPKFGACWASGYWVRRPRPALRLRGMKTRQGRKR